jgi:hypothetical protein
MTAKTDATPGADDDLRNSLKRSETSLPTSNGEPAESPPTPLDDMPVLPLTEDDDTNGG